jgi:DNA (cytosine-5)-methyltransferase 1
LAEDDLELQFEPRFSGPDRWRTVDDALSDLPIVESGTGSEDAVAYPCPPRNAFQRLMRRGSKGVHNHVSMRHAERSLQRFRAIKPGQSLVHAPPELGQRARNSGELDARPRFKMNNTRLRLDRPSAGITACYQGTFLHPTLHRVLTAREGARLQSFPDSFIFSGPRTLMSRKLLQREGREDEIGLSQYNQVGNAVPPLLARAVGSALERRTRAGNAGRRSDVGEAA